MSGAARALLQLALRDYAFYRIYASNGAARATDRPATVEITRSDLLARGTATIGRQGEYAGSGARLFGWPEGDKIVAMCAFWYGERYAARGFWPLAPGEAKLVQIVVDPEQRGRGIARRLIQEATAVMRGEGYARLYARIWHSNQPSIRAFEAAGWRRIASVVELMPRLGGAGVRVDWRAREHARLAGGATPVPRLRVRRLQASR